MLCTVPAAEMRHEHADLDLTDIPFSGSGSVCSFGMTDCGNSTFSGIRSNISM